MFKNIIIILKVIIFFRFEYFKPTKKKYLLFDVNHKNYLLKFINKKDLNVLYTRKEKINIFIVLINFFHFKFSFKNYLETYVNYSSPKYIFTFSDNNFAFFLLKKRRYTKKILIQNSWKNKYNDTFLRQKSKNFNVDYAFVFNKIIGKQLKDLLKCKLIVSGSFKNNCYKILKKKKKFKILFISSFRNYPNNLILRNNITYKDYDFFHKIAVKKISQFSSLRNIELFIYGNDQFQPEIEKEYFKNLDLKCKWKFIPNDRKISYKILDQSNLIVGTHSTLVYEALGRGAKVFVFSKKINDNLLVTHKYA